MTLASSPKRPGIASNRLVWAAMIGSLVWLAAQPTVRGYHPLVEMFWDPGLNRIPSWDGFVLLFSWLLTTLFGHFALFAIQNVRRRGEQRTEAGRKTPPQG
jgi:hypothetical protein